MVFFCSPLFAHKREKKKTVTADVDKRTARKDKKKSNVIERLRKEMKRRPGKDLKKKKKRRSLREKKAKKQQKRGKGLNKNSSFNASPRIKRCRREARFDSAS
jgi:hypothetical protein